MSDLPKSFLKAEESFLASQRAKEEPPVERKRRVRGDKLLNRLAREAVSSLSTVNYFRRILDDDTEKAIWHTFITGKAPDGTDVELNPISFQAFKLAVAYKRGTPVLTVRSKEDEGKQNVIEINVIGATPEFFEQQAKSRGLLTR